MKNTIVALFMVFSCQLSSQCFMDRHNTSITDTWLSCFKSINPNPARYSTHWIMYDLGDFYKLGLATIWNMNHPETSHHGIKDIVVDYTNDMVFWKSLGEFEIDQAGGNAKCEGQQAFDFEGKFARYVLISVLSTYGDGSCAGFSELRIETSGVSNDDVNIIMDDIIISPNPNHDFVTISCLEVMCNASYQIFNSNGQLIEQGNILDDKKIHVGSLPSGLYQCVLQRENQRLSQKFQVIH